MNTLNSDNAKLFENEKTLDFIATICGDGSPHITIFNSLLNKDDRTLMFGEYCRGLSKANLRENPAAAFLALGTQGEMVRGTAQWQGSKDSGEDHELFNNIPRFRYNAVYGYAHIHFLRLQEVGEVEQLPGGVPAAMAASQTLAGALPPAPAPGEARMGKVSRDLFTQEPHIKVLSYIAGDGLPRLLPVPQAVLDADRRVVISHDLMGEELRAIPADSAVAVISLVPAWGSSILVKGTLQPIQGGSALEISQVYSPNIPKAGYIYPRPPIVPVRVFQGADDV